MLMVYLIIHLSSTSSTDLRDVYMVLANVFLKELDFAICLLNKEPQQRSIR
jgi:hypothetical protein